MANVIALFTDRAHMVEVSGEEFVPGWNLYEVHIAVGEDIIRVGQFDLMPLVRRLYQAYEAIQKEEEEIGADEAVSTQP